MEELEDGVSGCKRRNRERYGLCKSHTLNMENFKDMLQICPRLPGQKFEEPSFEEEILSFIRDLGHTKEIKVSKWKNYCFRQSLLVTCLNPLGHVSQEECGLCLPTVGRPGISSGE
nr:hypothetical protein [Tanacetum cinerariifolium]